MEANVKYDYRILQSRSDPNDATDNDDDNEYDSHNPNGLLPRLFLEGIGLIHLVVSLHHIFISLHDLLRNDV